MGDESEAAQARELLRLLRNQVANISDKLDTAEGRRRRTSTRGAMLQRRQVSVLRRELCEAHRLIDGLHRRYPDTLTSESAVPLAR